MDIFIYFKNDNYIELYEIEEAIDNIIYGKGEVTGTGIGLTGCNIDICFYEKMSIDDVLAILCKLKLPNDAYCKIAGKNYKLYTHRA